VSGVKSLSDGKVNAVGLLFSDSDVSEYPSYPELDYTYQDYYNVTVQQNFTEYEGLPTMTLTILLPSGLEDPYAIEAGSIMKMQTPRYTPNDYPNPNNITGGFESIYYRTQVRGLVTKMPGF